MANSCCPLSCQGPEDLSAKLIIHDLYIAIEFEDTANTGTAVEIVVGIV